MRPREVKHNNRGNNQTQNTVLGYIKLPLTDLANSRVRHEATILERLSNFSALRSQIPSLLYHGNWNSTYLLFQSRLEGNVGPTNFTDVHREFLQALWNVYQVERSGMFLVQKVAAKWERMANMLGAAWIELGREVLGRATRFLCNKRLSLRITHGDFAPWNTRVRHEKLVLFDWESADWEAPGSWDVSHFKLLTSSSLRKTGLEYCDDDLASRITFMLYLLSSVCQMFEEGNRHAIAHRKTLLTTALQQN
jgi:hypothetical protein